MNHSIFERVSTKCISSNSVVSSKSYDAAAADANATIIILFSCGKITIYCNFATKKVIIVKLQKIDLNETKNILKQLVLKNKILKDSRSSIINLEVLELI